MKTEIAVWDEDGAKTKMSANNITLYVDTMDALAHVDITRRQLRHWEENGLLKPELGKNRYTEKDLERLRLIKRLVVQEGFPVEVLRRLFEKQLWNEEFDQETYERGRKGDLTNHVLDIDSGALLSRAEMFTRLWHEFLAEAVEHELYEIMQQVMLVYFREARHASSHPLAYIGHIEIVFDRVRDLSKVARLESVHNDDEPSRFIGIRLRPLLPGETEESEDLDALFDRNEPVVTELQGADIDVTWRGRRPKPGRFEAFSDYIDYRS